MYDSLCMRNVMLIVALLLHSVVCRCALHRTGSQSEHLQAESTHVQR